MAERRFDVAIVGGGPAGQAAALALAPYDLSVAVIDEQPRPGGQILRQPPAGVTTENWLPGRSYTVLKRQLACFTALPRMTWLGGRSVIGLADGAVQTHGTAGSETIAAARILLAAGCHDLAVPLPGWTLPGVHTAGAIQTLLKSQHVLAGERILFAGTHPLQLVIAEQVVRAGGTVAGVLFAQPRRAMLAPLLRAPAAAVQRLVDLLAGGTALRTLRRAGVPIRFGAAVTALTGGAAVERAETTIGTVACDAIGLCYGFVPQSALPRLAGAAVMPAGPAGGWRCGHDAWMRSSVDGLYVAGETVGVAGAAAASAGGTIAGIGIACDLGLVAPGAAETLAARARTSLAAHRRFAAILDAIADPRPYLPAPAPDTLVCRCEDLPYEAVVKAIADGASANAVKLATRCGMGLCQGRNCEPTLLRLIAAQRGPGDPGFTSRFPARPVAIGDLLA